jgi:hypothetical protein
MELNTICQKIQLSLYIFNLLKKNIKNIFKSIDSFI